MILRSLALSMLTLALVISCSSKQKPEETAAPAVGDTTNDSAIVNKPLSFDAAGSDSGSIDGLYTVNFDYDKSTLTEEGKKKLADNAKWINENSGVNVQVEGHCDDRGSIEYNLALGEQRAKAAKAYLVSLGVDAKRLSVISYGKEKPVAQGDSEQAFFKNRRANFVPLPK